MKKELNLDIDLSNINYEWIDEMMEYEKDFTCISSVLGKPLNRSDWKQCEYDWAVYADFDDRPAQHK